MWKRKYRTKKTPNQAAAPELVSEAGGLNNAQNAAAHRGTPRAIQGFLRPHRVRVRSEIQPMSGSVKASSARAKAIASARYPSGTRTTSA